MVTAIDTNILLDILIPDKRHFNTSKKLLDEACGGGALIICEIVYVELANQFETLNDLEQFLTETGIRLKKSNEKSLYESSIAWKKYLENRKSKITCASCGSKIRVNCAECGAGLKIKQHILSDFLIGGHALEHADILLTRDRGYYSTYFKTLRVRDGLRK